MSSINELFSIKSLKHLQIVIWFGTIGCTEKPNPDEILSPEEETDDPYFCASQGSVQATDDGSWMVESEHYLLYAQSTEEETAVLSAILEAGWLAMADWFDAQPELNAGEYLSVKFYADVGAWEQGIIADGLEVPVGAAGYYHSTTETAYLYVQPTLYYTRQLLIHEAIHQFHHLARLQEHSIPGWYAEGHAEYLSLYDWDGECLRLGRLPLLTQEDRPASALDQLSSVNLTEHFNNLNSISRSLEWAIFRFFDHSDDGALSEQWAQFRAAMDSGGTDPVVEFELIFGQPPAHFDADLQSWLLTEQQPMNPLYLEWLHEGSDMLTGWSEYFSIAPIKNGTNHFSTRFESPVDESWSGGVLLSFQDSSNWVALVAGSDDRLNTFEVISGDAMWWDQGSLPTPQNGIYTFAVEHTNTESIILINDQEMTLPLLFPASGGPALNGTSLQFTDIVWE